MFGKKKAPDKPFSYSDNCRILAADPDVKIEWSELGGGHWRAVCQCGQQDHYEPADDARVRNDPLDPSTSRHLGQCEHRDTNDPAVLRLILKVRDGAGDDYWWVTCLTCETAWPVPLYAAESVG